MKGKWLHSYRLHILTFTTSSGTITESVEYLPDQSKVRICLESTYEKIEIPCLTPYLNRLLNLTLTNFFWK